MYKKITLGDERTCCPVSREQNPCVDGVVLQLCDQLESGECVQQHEEVEDALKGAHQSECRTEDPDTSARRRTI